MEMPLLSGESGAASTNPFFEAIKPRRAINKKEIPLRNILLLENRRRNHPVDIVWTPGAHRVRVVGKPPLKTKWNHPKVKIRRIILKTPLTR